MTTLESGPFALAFTLGAVLGGVLAAAFALTIV